MIGRRQYGSEFLKNAFFWRMMWNPAVIHNSCGIPGAPFFEQKASFIASVGNPVNPLVKPFCPNIHRLHRQGEASYARVYNVPTTPGPPPAGSRRGHSRCTGRTSGSWMRTGSSIRSRSHGGALPVTCFWMKPGKIAKRAETARSLLFIGQRARFLLPISRYLAVIS